MLSLDVHTDIYGCLCNVVLALLYLSNFDLPSIGQGTIMFYIQQVHAFYSLPVGKQVLVSSHVLWFSMIVHEIDGTL